ncbi:hypothetical protein RN001_016268 [Aquatica leii]|uniref:Conserved oligomeric Golgi complex subunit 2 n=1 Tax=Aquatica leii TaxID=1421715 RepID=A0AAN7SB89_9COLE|nr:hypothetical protein RN001_016268 [Aquatica leii]
MDSNKVDHLFTDTFFKVDFKIDNYLSQCVHKSDLLTLRNDLKNYGVELYTLMVDILKTETEGIVNLAENLTGLNVKIDDLYTPISQLCEEIRSLYHAINDTETNFKEYLDKVESVINEKDYVNLKINVMTTSFHINNVILSLEKNEDMTTLERAVDEYSFQYLYLKEMGLEKIILENNMQNTARRLLNLVEEVFLKALKEKDEVKILMCLRMYVNLAQQSAAEESLRKNIVTPILHLIFTQRNLDDHGQDVKPLYNQAIQFFHQEISLVLNVLHRNPDLKGFDFVINSFWVEVDKQLRNNLPNITAPGNPELFQKRFKDTWRFLEEIANISGDKDLFKRNLSLEAHMKRFNLPVYFEILFQQISAKFESELLLDLSDCDNYDWNKINASDNLFKLKVTESLWSSIKQCFDDGVFLTHLVDQILKLMILLLSRYLKWFDGCLKKWKMSSGNCNIEQLEKIIIFALIDFKTLKSLIARSHNNLNDFDDTIFKIIPMNVRPAFNKILEINEQSLDQMYEKLQQHLVHFIVKQSIVHLQQVTSIPRLYRRTNRNLPQKPSNYVFDTVLPLADLHKKYNEIMGDDILPFLNSIITQLGYQYLTLVQEVLRSVCKTEESLRRLKNRNLNINDESTGQGNGDAITDEAKIREQIKKDVRCFVTELKPFSLSNSNAVFQLLIAETSNVVNK